MEFDYEGHLLISPREIGQLLSDDKRWFLINSVLIPGTPHIFETYQKFQSFCESLSDGLRIHPRNFVFRGSTKLGFSLAPFEDKAWVRVTPESDVDLAIIDADYYHVIDRELRHLELMPLSRARYVKDTEPKRRNRRSHRQFYCYRYFDLPQLDVIRHQENVLKNVPPGLLDAPRILSAFIFRDWWSLFDRWDSDLRELKRKLNDGSVPASPRESRPAEESVPTDDATE